MKDISLHQQIKFKRHELSEWESGSMYIYLNSNDFVIEDSNLNPIEINNIFDYSAIWYE